MEYGSIEREIQVDASPEIVFDVVSSPEHLKEWWPDEAAIEPRVGAEGHIVFRRDPPEGDTVVRVMVMDARPPRHFSFRWVYEEGQVPSPSNSFLVTFDLEPVGKGTLVKMKETGFREQGWEEAVAQEAHRDHSEGWDYFIPRLGAYLARLVPTS